MPRYWSAQWHAFHAALTTTILVVLIRPQESLRAFMANLPEGMEDFIFSDNEQLDELFYAFNKRNRYYTMYEVEEFDGNYTDDIKELSAEEESTSRRTLRPGALTLWSMPPFQARTT